MILYSKPFWLPHLLGGCAARLWPRSQSHQWRWRWRERERGKKNIYKYLIYSTCLTGYWWFGAWILFFHILGIIIPTDFHIFQRGWSTTNQLRCLSCSWWFLTFLFFHNIWGKPSHWLSYFSRWVNPPTSHSLYTATVYHSCGPRRTPWCTWRPMGPWRPGRFPKIGPPMAGWFLLWKILWNMDDLEVPLF